ncbi:MAG: NADP-dependent oxidoreductase [Pontibacterium sp.]
MRSILISSFEQPKLTPTYNSPKPSPAAGEVLVKNQAAGINPIDWKTCHGIGPVKAEQLPFVAGWEFSGVVEALGEGVEGFAVGDPVFGLARFPTPGGCFADYVSVPANQVCPRPHGVPSSTAAALSIAGLTAWQALFEIGEFKANQRVLILGGAGGVGHLAIQLAKWADASEVITTSSAGNHTFLSALGADQRVDYHTTAVADAVKDVDLIIDCVGGQTGIDALPCLADHGIMVTLPSVTKAEVIEAASKQGKEARGCVIRNDVDQLAKLAFLIERGAVIAHISAQYPLEDLAKAFEQSRSGRTKGKIVVTF